MSKWMLWPALFITLSGTAAGADGALTVGDAWVREAPPGAPVNAAYFTIRNDDDATHVLIGAASPQFARAEFHASRVTGGRVRMQRVENLEVPRHGSLSFAPGDYHLMLIDPHRPLKAGDRVELTLEFKDAPAVTVQASVGSGEAAADMPHQGAAAHHHMDGM